MATNSDNSKFAKARAHVKQETGKVYNRTMSEVNVRRKAFDGGSERGIAKASKGPAKPNQAYGNAIRNLADHPVVKGGKGIGRPRGGK